LAFGAYTEGLRRVGCALFYGEPSARPSRVNPMPITVPLVLER
jgi:hypothetical protein